MAQTVHGRSEGSGRLRTSGAPFNIKTKENVEKIGEIVQRDQHSYDCGGG
jgi:hypothetical protein